MYVHVHVGLGEPEECLIGIYENFHYTREQCARSYINNSDLELDDAENFIFLSPSELDITDSIIPSCGNYTWKGMFLCVHGCVLLYIVTHVVRRTCTLCKL